MVKSKLLSKLIGSSNEITLVLLCFIISFVIASILYKWIKSWNYPPGPIGLPFLGYGPFLGKNPHLVVHELIKKYGKIISFYIGPNLNVFCFEYEDVKEILSNSYVLDRPPNVFPILPGSAGFGFVGMSGEPWQEQRRFAIHSMRNLGLGKGPWETMIQEDVAELIEEAKQWQGKPIDFINPLTMSQSKNSLELLIGKHLDKDSPDIKILLQTLDALNENISGVNIASSSPWFTKIMEKFNLFGFRDFLKQMDKFQYVFRKEVMARLKSKEDTNQEDFINSYLNEMEKRENSTEPHSFNVDTLVGNMILLFFAGNDSTISSMAWMLLLMANNQDVQKKIHEEIDNAIGRDGVVDYDDRYKLPYTMAALVELQRWTTISPLFPPRQVSKTFTFRGYTIPEGCRVICSSWSMMKDTKYFKNPKEFKPERFLSENGDKIVKVEGYGAFSFGKRNCPGEGIAHMTIYLYFVSMMQKFHVITPDGSPADLEPIFRTVLQPKPQKLCFIER